MRRLLKTLFGDLRTVIIAAACIVIALGLLVTPVRQSAGLVLPVLLLAATGYLARH